MEEYRRHLRIWKTLYPVVSGYVRRKFALDWDTTRVDGPMLLIANHVTAWDPLLIASALDGRQIYFVASEHIFRLGWVSKLLHWLVAPIARRKGTVGLDTVKACLKHLREGHSVCLFAEGEGCWAGVNSPIFPATGKLAKSCGATLVTMRIEGGYLSLPRWAKGVRRGRVHIATVGVYPPEVLAGMSAKDINEAISRDIREDAWQRAREMSVTYKGKAPAEGLEKAFYLCPGCRGVGTLQTAGDTVSCRCGWRAQYTPFLSPAAPFETLSQWDEWQKKTLHDRDFPHGEVLFSDEDITLTKVDAGHRSQHLCRGTLRQYEGGFSIGEYHFSLSDISQQAMVRTHLLLFSAGADYYELRAENGANLRKYLEIWEEK